MSDLRVLLVCAAPPSDPAHVAGLAAEHDVVIAVDGGASACAKAGVIPSLVVGDLDSLDTRTRLGLAAAGVAFEVFSADKDESDLDLSLQIARERGYTEITVTGAFSARLDHTLVAMGSLAHAADLRPRIAEPDISGWIVAAGARDSVRLTGMGATVSVLPLLESAVVTTTGMRWPLAEDRLGPLSSRGLSNTIAAETGEVRVAEGVVVVLSPRTDVPMAREDGSGAHES